MDLTKIPVYLVGMIGDKHNGLYKKVLPMFFAFAVQEAVYTVFYGLRRVIPNEMYNEAMDYCEWRNGYRTEAMTSVAKGLATKLAGLVSNLLSLQIKKYIGYDITSYTRGEAQTDDTKHGLFVMCTIIPALTCLLGIIPIFFYDLSGEKRERMYAELLKRREDAAKLAMTGDQAAMEELAKQQMAVGEKKQKL
jgi:Na+/melibiose symporter-like transporter